MARHRIVYLRFHRDLFKVLCIFPPKKRTIWKTSLAVLFHTSLILMLLFQLAGELMDFSIHLSEIDIWTDAASIIVYTSMSILRLLILIYKRDKLLKLLSTWEEMFVRKAPFKPDEKDVRKWIAKTKIYIIVTMTFTMMAAFHWSIYPIAVALLFPDNWERKLPVRVWYPMDIHASPTYELIYFTQLVRAIFTPYLWIICHTTLMSFCILTCYQVTELKARLRGVGTVAKENETAVVRDKQVDGLEEEFERCIQYHRAIISFVKKIEDLYSQLLVVDLLAAIAPLCFTALKATNIRTNDTRFLVWLEYFMVCLTQLFVFCLGGNEVTTRLTSIQSSAYEVCGRATSGMRWKIAFMMLHSNVELKITGGRFFVLSLETFKRIVAMAFSNFIVLRQLKDSKAPSKYTNTLAE